MSKQQNLLDLASQIYECERAGRDISAGWFQFEQADRPSVEQLKTLCEQSRNLLHDMSRGIDAKLEQGDGKNRTLQHAYNIVQELILSRTASEEMLENILNHGTEYQEFYRALSIKERAAEQQARQLKDALSQVH